MRGRSTEPSLASQSRPSTPAPSHTPSQDVGSDSVSLNSAPISRASSPPPSRVGTAPKRELTKNQQKKERQAKAKAAEEAEKGTKSATGSTVGEVVQAPIVGRKKKTKKSSTINDVPMKKDSLPSSPKVKPTSEVKEPIIDVSKKDTKEKVATPPLPAPETPSQPKEKTINQLLSDIVREFDLANCALFKNPPNLNHRYDLSITEDLDFPLFNDMRLSQSELDALNHKEAVSRNLKIFNKPINLTLTPEGGILRGFSAEEEAHIQDLERRLFAEQAGPTRFHAPRATQGATAAAASAEMDIIARMHHEFETLKQLREEEDGGFPLSLTDEVIGLANAAVGRTMGGGGGGSRQADLLKGKGMEELKGALDAARKEAEAFEKKVNAAVKKNRKVVAAAVGH